MFQKWEKLDTYVCECVAERAQGWSEDGDVFSVLLKGNQVHL